MQRGREIDLIGRDLQHVGAAGREGSSASTGTPILPPICASRPALLRRCAISAVVVDLPLVPVMAMSGHCAPDLARSRQNNSMSPMISTSALRASAAAQCGCGCVSGTPGASTSAAICDQSSSRRSCVLRPAACASASFPGVVVEGDDLGAALDQRARRQQSRIAEAEDRDMLAGEGGDRDHRNFNVARPASASTTATIQNRITICGSVQPSCSK